MIQIESIELRREYQTNTQILQSQGETTHSWMRGPVADQK